jgi:archaellum biogenesis protein FlaJ (TadC family)
MTDWSLTIASAAVELGVPLVLVVVCILAPGMRRRATVVLGALTPLLAAYLYVAVGYLAAPKEYLWALGALWSMSLIAFIACAVVGVALSFSARPRHVTARYLLGFAAPLPVWLLFLAGV